TKRSGRARVRRTFKAGRRSRNLTEFREQHIAGRDVQERMLANDWIISFEHVLLVRVQQVAWREGVIVQSGMTAAIAIPRLQAHSPAIFDRHEVARFLPFARHDSRAARET